MGSSVIGSLDPQVWNLLGTAGKNQQEEKMNGEKGEQNKRPQRILVTGATGQLGYDVCKELNRRKMGHIGVSSKDFDITDKGQAAEFIRNYCPDVIIHCAAYTAVDKAEDEPEKCFAVNEGGTCNIAEICKELNCKMVYISTDYVFPGTGDQPFKTSDETCPKNVYGRSKLAGEKAVQELLAKYFIVRISWVFGLNGNNFVKTMLRIGKDNQEVNVVSDQVGSPTYTADLAPLLCDMAATEKYGVYHATNEGECSWAEFAEEIFKIAKYNTKANRILTGQFPAKAPRPKNSRLDKSRLDAECFNRLPPWQDALRNYLAELMKSE